MSRRRRHALETILDEATCPNVMLGRRGGLGCRRWLADVLVSKAAVV